MRISRSDKISILQRCTTCFGDKKIKNELGNEIPCSNCNGTGEVTVYPSLHDLVNFIGEEMAQEVRRRGGSR